jgi:hypothetical protein
VDGAAALKIMKSVAVTLLLVCSACDQDPFHQRERPVLAGYELQQWEDSKKFYLIKSGEKDNGGGVVDGTVTRIGWNGRYVVAERKANFGGDKDGWMIIDTSTGTVLGPFSDVDLKSRPEMYGISIMTADQAWHRLH